MLVSLSWFDDLQLMKVPNDCARAVYKCSDQH